MLCHLKSSSCQGRPLRNHTYTVVIIGLKSIQNSVNPSCSSAMLNLRDYFLFCSFVAAAMGVLNIKLQKYCANVQRICFQASFLSSANYDSKVVTI